MIFTPPFGQVQYTCMPVDLLRLLPYAANSGPDKTFRDPSEYWGIGGAACLFYEEAAEDFYCDGACQGTSCGHLNTILGGSRNCDVWTAGTLLSALFGPVLPASGVAL